MATRIGKVATVTVEYQGKQRLLAELAEESGIAYGVLHHRIFKLKWDVEKALAKPIKRKRFHRPWAYFDGIDISEY